MEAAAPGGGDERRQRQRQLEEEERGGGGGGGRRRNQDQDQETEAVYCAVGIGTGNWNGSGSQSQEWKANLRWVLAALAPHQRSSSKRLVLAHLRRPTSRINIMGAWVPVSQLAEEEVAAYRQLEEERIGKVLDDLLEICQSQKVNASKIVIASDDIARGLVQLVDDHGVTELVMGAASDRAYSRKMRTPRSKKALTVQRKANPSCRIWYVCRGNLICTREAGEGHAHRAESSTASSSPRSSASDCSRSKSSPCLRSCETFSTQEPDDPSAEQTPARDRSGIEDSNRQATAVAGSSAESISEIVGGLEIEEEQKTPALDGSDDAGEMDDALYERLKHAVVEAESLKQEAYEERRRRQMAERELAEASRMAEEAERAYEREARRRKAAEETVARARAAMEQDRRALVGVLDKAREADARSAALELQIASSERAGTDLEARLSESYGLLHALRRQGPRQGGDHPCTDEDGEQRGVSFFFPQLGHSEELDEACTKHFVHEAQLVVPGGGSLEERLGPELPWQARCGVAYGACSALAFLHSTMTVHGDVRPANILVLEDKDGGWSCKLAVGGGGADRRRAYADPTAAAAGEVVTPRGDVYALGVVLLRLVTGKPPFLARKAARDAAAGRASVAEEGGWPPEQAREVGLLGLRCCGVDVDVDVEADSSDFSSSSAAAAARMLLEEARAVLEAAMTSAAAAAEPSTSSREWDSDSDGGGGGGAPSYLVCPIRKEVMRDPQVAGDGFTYEAEAIAEWLRGGHDTSPMTNLRLPTRKLVPNHALRDAIHEWRHRHRLLN